MPRPKIDSIGCQVDKVLGGFRPTLYHILFDYNTKWLYSFKYQTKFFLECSLDLTALVLLVDIFMLRLLNFLKEIWKIDFVKGKLCSKRLFMSYEN